MHVHLIPEQILATHCMLSNFDGCNHNFNPLVSEACMGYTQNKLCLIIVSIFNSSNDAIGDFQSVETKSHILRRLSPKGLALKRAM